MGVSVREKIKQSGEFWVFVRHNGQRASQKIGDEETAREVARTVKSDIARGQFDITAVQRQPAPKKEEKTVIPTLREFFEKTMTPIWEKSKARKTADRYGSSFRTHILPVLGNVPIDQITRQQVKDFTTSLLAKNVTKRREATPDRCLSRNSIRLVVAALRATFTEIIELDIRPDNPAAKLGHLYKKAENLREEPDPFTEEEVPLLLDAMLTHFGFENYVLCLTALHTGMRASELAGLKWDDVDFRNRFILVRRQYRGGRTKKTKTGARPKVNMSNVLATELQSLRKRRQEDCPRRGAHNIPEWVFVDRTGTPPDMNNWRNRVFLKACDKAKIRRRRLHDTRHTMASILLMNGESPAYVKEQLGHASIKLTVDTYGTWIPGANREAMDRLPSLETTKSEKSRQRLEWHPVAPWPHAKRKVAVKAT